MNFTADWFTHNIPNFEKCLKDLPERKRILEIGAYEGRATCWLIKNMDDYGTIYSIDPYPNMPEIEERFIQNTRNGSQGNQHYFLFD